jgi:hypothetical protein
MIGLSLGKKAVKYGYKRAGIPGAIATGSAAAVGYMVVKRALTSRTNDENVDEAIDTDRIKSAVNERGVSAVTDRETLESAVDEDQLDSTVDIGNVQSEAEDETDDIEPGTADDTAS